MITRPTEAGTYVYTSHTLQITHVVEVTKTEGGAFYAKFPDSSRPMWVENLYGKWYKYPQELLDRFVAYDLTTT